MRAEVTTGSELGQTLDKMMKEGAIVPIVRNVSIFNLICREMVLMVFFFVGNHAGID